MSLQGMYRSWLSIAYPLYFRVMFIISLSCSVTFSITHLNKLNKTITRGFLLSPQSWVCTVSARYSKRTFLSLVPWNVSSLYFILSISDIFVYIFLVTHMFIVFSATRSLFLIRVLILQQLLLYKKTNIAKQFIPLLSISDFFFKFHSP